MYSSSAVPSSRFVALRHAGTVNLPISSKKLWASVDIAFASERQALRSALVQSVPIFEAAAPSALKWGLRRLHMFLPRTEQMVPAKLALAMWQQPAKTL